jgi:molybdopterin-guanine dinucleotide biosynthesis protein MobB
MTAELSVAPSCNQTNNLNNSNDKATVATTPVVAVIGLSNSGKALVVAASVESLTARGLNIATIKHCLHGLEPTPTNSDLDRLYGAGSVVTIASSPDQRTTIERVV